MLPTTTEHFKRADFQHTLENSVYVALLYSVYLITFVTWKHRIEFYFAGFVQLSMLNFGMKIAPSMALSPLISITTQQNSEICMEFKWYLNFSWIETEFWMKNSEIIAIPFSAQFIQPVSLHLSCIVPIFLPGKTQRHILPRIGSTFSTVSDIQCYKHGGLHKLKIMPLCMMKHLVWSHCPLPEKLVGHLVNHQRTQGGFQRTAS